MAAGTGPGHHLELGRNSCQNRSICERGCSFGANHTSLSSSLPAAERTGNLTIITDAIVHSLDARLVQGDPRLALFDYARHRDPSRSWRLIEVTYR